MTEFEKALQECLHDLEQGAASVDECLMRHREHASELAPVLFASETLGQAGQAHVSDRFKARVRTRLLQEMHTHPRTARLKPVGTRFGFMITRLTVGFAIILLALLVTGTAYAQSTLPGDAFYGWKLASENAWRAVSSDPVETDLAIAERRVNELAVVKDDPALRTQTLDVYLKTVTRLKSQTDPVDEIRINQKLGSQIEKLKKLGILLSRSDPAALPSDEPIPLPTATTTPLPTLETPQVHPTDLPQITPTIRIPPKIIPTVEIPPELIPTFEVPPPIR